MNHDPIFNRFYIVVSRDGTSQNLVPDGILLTKSYYHLAGRRKNILNLSAENHSLLETKKRMVYHQPEQS